ncbi:MAG: hypothetical protein RLY61_427 [Candidatus Parcubacteria bacterium]
MDKLNSDIEKVISKIIELIKNSAKPRLVALDGRSGTGKTTIAKHIASRLDGVVILADNFWIGGPDEEWDLRTPQEKSEQAIDWKRIRMDVLEPLLAGKPASWHPFNWKAGEGLDEEPIEAQPTKLVILDGAYSSRPELQDIIDLSVLVEVPDDNNRRGRLINREGKEYMDDWHKRWDPAEDYYFSKVRPKSSFDMIITNH